jgi:hypothetical protein
MSQHIDPTTLSPEGRRVTAFLRGPIKAGQASIRYALATRECIRNGQRHLPVLDGFPIVQDNLQDDEGIQTGSTFSAGLVAPEWAYDVGQCDGHWDGYSLVSLYGESPTAFTRNLPIPVPNWEGKYDWTLPDEFAPAAGCRRIENLLNRIAGANSVTLAGVTLSGATLSSEPDADGFYTMTRTGAGSSWAQLAFQSGNVGYSMANKQFTASIEVKRVAVNTAFDLRISDVTTTTQVSPGYTATADAQLFSATLSGFANTGYVGAIGITLNTNGDAIKIRFPQCEDVTGASVKAPSQRVSVGAVTAWPYHGFGKDGIVWSRAFNRNTVNPTTGVVTVYAPTQQRLAWLYLPGRTGNTLSTPNAAANQITGDIVIIAQLVVPAATTSTILEGSYAGASTSTNFLFQYAAGPLRYYWAVGATLRQVDSADLSAAVPVGSLVFVRLRHTVNNAGNRTIEFAWSYDETNWSVLTTSTSAVGVGARNAGTNAWFIGAWQGTNDPYAGRVLQVKVFNGFAATTPAVWPDASRFIAGGASAAMTTGETWTINTSGAGNVAKIVEAFTDATQRPSRHDSAETQLITTQINAWPETGTTSTTAAIGPDGLLSAWTLTDNDAAAFQFRRESFAVPNNSLPYAAAYLVKKDAITTRMVGLDFWLFGGTQVHRIVTLNTATGESAPDAVFGPDGSHTVEDAGDWWIVRGTVTNNNSGNTGFIVTVYPAVGTALGTSLASATGSATFAWPTLVQSTRVSNFNTPGGGTRNEAVLTLPNSVVNNGEGFVYAEYQLDQVPPADRRILGDSALNRTPLYIVGSTNRAIGAYDGVGNPAGTTPISTARTRVATAWSGANMSLWCNGVQEADVAYDGGWDGTSWNVGGANGPSAAPSGSIGPLKWGKRRPSATFLANLNSARDRDFTRAEFEDIRDTINGTTWEYELLTELPRADGTTLEWSYKTLATAKGVSVSPQRLSAQFAQVDLIGADRTFPFLTLNTTDWPNMAEADQNAPLRDGIGTLRKIKLYWITFGGGVWGYAALRKRTGHTYTILAVYRDKQVVPTAEYIAATRTAPSGYDVFCVNFGSEQKDTKTGPYEILADVLVQGPGTYNSREASAELDWLLKQYGYRTVAASVAACITEDQTRGMFVDGAYSVPVAGTSLINELAQVARVRLAPTADGSIDFIQDRPTGSTFALKESATTVEVLNYDVPVPPKYVELKYRRLNDQGSDFEFVASRSHSVGGTDSKTYRNRFIDDHDVAQRWISLKSKLALSLRTANIRFSAAQYFAGEVGSIDGVSCFRGARNFMLLGGSRGGDASEVRAREYDATIYAPGSYTLPTGASNVYQPDLSFTPPAAPTGLTYVSGSSSTSISADGVGRAYMFYQVTPPAQNFVKIMFNATDGVSTVRTEAKKNGSVYEASITGLRPGVSHVIQAQAVNINGIEGAVVSETRNSPGYATAPNAPSSVSGQQKGTKTIQYVFVPSSSPNIDYYQYQITDNFGSSYGSPTRTPGTPIDYNFPTVGGTYGCRVRAVDKFGNVSAYSGTYYVGATAIVTDTVITPSGITSPSLASATIPTSRLNLTSSYVSTSIAAGGFYYVPLTSTLMFLPSVWSSADGDFTLRSEGSSMYQCAFKNETGVARTISITMVRFVV